MKKTTISSSRQSHANKRKHSWHSQPAEQNTKRTRRDESSAHTAYAQSESRYYASDRHTDRRNERSYQSAQINEFTTAHSQYNNQIPGPNINALLQAGNYRELEQILAAVDASNIHLISMFLGKSRDFGRKAEWDSRNQQALTMLIDLSLIKLTELAFAGKDNLNFYRGIFYGLGLCAEQDWLKKGLDEERVAKVIDKLLGQQNPLPPARKPQEIANTIHGLGKLAEKGLLLGINTAALASTLVQLTQALSNKQPNGQAIANTIHGLGKLVEWDLFSGINPAILAEPVIKLTHVLNDIRPNAQDIANTLHGLGKLVEWDLFSGINPAILADAVIKLPQALQKRQPNARDIANTIHGLSKLAEKGLFSGINTAALASTLVQLTQALSNKQPNAQAIANTIHGLGKLVEWDLFSGINPAILVEPVIKLTHVLNDTRPNAQDIANTIHGLGKLVEWDLFSGINPAILADAVIKLTHVLNDTQPNAQDIANTLHGLGKLAEKGLFSGINTAALARTLVQLTQALSNKQPTAQAIANTIHGLGKLVEWDLFSGINPAILADAVIKLPQALSNKQPNAQDIANTLHGLGKLAEKGLFSGINTAALASTLVQLTQALSNKQPTAQAIANTIHGLGKLVEWDLFSGINPAILVEPVIKLIHVLNDTQPNAQAIANTIHGLGKLAEKGLFSGINTAALADTLVQLTQALSNKQPDAQNIANTIHGLGKLVEWDLFSGINPAILVEPVIKLTHVLNDTQPTAQNIANTLHGLGKLAEKGLFSGINTAALADTLVQLTQALSNKQPTAQNIANTIHGLGKLVEWDLFSGINPAILVEPIIKLTHVLNDTQPTAQNIANTIHGLGKLAERDLIPNTYSAILAEPIIKLTQALQKKQPNTQEIANTIHSLGKLAKKKLLTVPTDLSLATQALLRRLYMQLLYDKNRRRSIHIYHLTSSLTGYGQLLRAREPQRFSDRELQDLANLSRAALTYRLNANKLYFMALTLHSLRAYSTQHFAQQFDQVCTRLQPLLAELSAESREKLDALQESLPAVMEVDTTASLLADDVAPVTQVFNLANANDLAQFSTYLSQQARTYTDNETVAITIKSVAVINSLGAYTNQAVAANQCLGYYEGDIIRDVLAVKNSRYAYDREDGYYVDATKKCNWTVFINHSPIPNAVVRYEGMGSQRKIGIYTLRSLQAGEQLLLDYGPNYFQYLDELIVPKYLHPTDNEQHPFDYYQAHTPQYQEVLTFNPAEQQALGLKTAYLRVPHVSNLLAYSMHNARRVNETDFVESTQQQQLTWLMLACYLGRMDRVKHLLDAPDIDVNRQATLSGDTAICFALKGRASHTQKLMMVEAIKAHPRYQSQQTGQTDDVLLYLALTHNCPAVVNWLLPKEPVKERALSAARSSATPQPSTRRSSTPLDTQAADIIRCLVEEQRDDILGQLVHTDQLALFERVIANYRLQDLFSHLREGLLNLRLMLKDSDEVTIKQVVACLLKQGQCYRDSQVVEHLVNGLAACHLLQPEHVRDLQQEVLERAKDFHGNRHHRHVMDRLDILEKTIQAAYRAVGPLAANRTTVTPSQQANPPTARKIKKRRRNTLYDTSEDESETQDSPVSEQSAVRRTTVAPSQQANLPTARPSTPSAANFFRTARKSRPSQDSASSPTEPRMKLL